MWYLFRNGEQYGPYSEEQILTALQAGEIKQSDYLWNENLSDWTPIGNINFFQNIIIDNPQYFEGNLQTPKEINSNQIQISDFKNLQKNKFDNNDFTEMPQKNGNNDIHKLLKPLTKLYFWIGLIIIYLLWTFYLERYLLPASAQTKKAEKIYEMIGYHGKSRFSNQDNEIEIWKKDFESYQKIYKYYPKSLYAAEAGFKLALMYIEKGKTKTAAKLLDEVSVKYAPQIYAIESLFILGNIYCGLPLSINVSYGEVYGYGKTEYCREGEEAVPKNIENGIKLFREISEKYGQNYRTSMESSVRMEDVVAALSERKQIDLKKTESAGDNFKQIALRQIALYYCIVEDYSKAEDLYKEFYDENLSSNDLKIEYACMLAVKLDKTEEAIKILDTIKNAGENIDYLKDSFHNKKNFR